MEKETPNETPKQPKSERDRVWDRALEAMEKAQKEILRLSRVGKMHLDTTLLQKDRHALLQRLGEVTFQMVKDDHFEKDRIETLVKEIDALNTKIKESREEITHSRMGSKSS